MKIIVYCANSDQMTYDPVSAKGRPLFCSDDPGVRDAAEHAFQDLWQVTETMALREIDGCPDERSSLLRRLLWGICFLLGIGHLAESRRSVTERLSPVIQTVLENRSDCIVAARPFVLRVLLRELERRGFSVLREFTGLIRPGERIRVTEKAAHCGGCRHNCLLSNPGCGVGKDKAMRYY